MRRILLATSLVLALLVPAVAALAADRPQDLLIDACRDEKVDGTYSQRTYKRALDQLPADSDQYTACRDVINRARLAALNNRSGRGSSGGGGGTTAGGGGTTGGGGGGGSTGSSGGSSKGTAAPAPPTPAEQKAVQHATASGAEPVRIGGQLVQPGAVGHLSSGSRDLPTPLIGLLALFAVGLIAAAGLAGRNRVLARRAS